MSPLRPAIRLAGRGYFDTGSRLASDGFIMDVTRPTIASSSPDPNLGTPEPYTGPNAGGILTVSTPQTFVGVDFGNTRIKRAANNVSFEHCIFNNTTGVTNGPGGHPTIDFRDNRGGSLVYRCAFRNLAQNGWSNMAIMGDGFKVERSYFEGYQDHINAYVHTSNFDGPIDVEVAGSYLGPMGFFWYPTTGVVHPSDTKGHNDCIQCQGGRGIHIHGNVILAHYSETVGTGTPNSGGEFVSGVPYTQAEGEAQRYAIVMGGGTYATPGTQGYALGGSISGLMFNNDRGATPDAYIHHNWGSGGAFWLNAGEAWTNDPALAYDFGEVAYNLVQDNQRTNDWAISVTSGTTANVHDNYWCDASWNSTGVLIPRKNG